MINKLNSKLFKLHIFLQNIKKQYLILIFIFFNLFFSSFFQFLASIFLDDNLSNGFKSLGTIYEEFFLGVILAPILETLFIQFAIIESIKNKFKPLTCCVISASVFALLHTYNIFYVMFAFCSGILFSYLYITQKSITKGIIYTVIMHMGYNLIAFASKHI